VLAGSAAAYAPRCLADELRQVGGVGVALRLCEQAQVQRWRVIQERGV
jgi:hypothetical protein